MIKPAHELLGEILLRAARPKEAVEPFATSLRRHPNRARSLLGAARAGALSARERAAVFALGDLVRGLSGFGVALRHDPGRAIAALPWVPEIR